MKNILYLFLFMSLTVAVFSESADELLINANNLIEKRQYYSAFQTLNSSHGSDSKVIAKQVEITTNYFITSIMHTMFTLKDLSPDEDLNVLRQAPGNYTAVLFDPREIIPPLLEKKPDDGILAKAMGDWYYDGQNRYGNDWIVSSEEALKQAYTYYEIAIKNNVYDYLTLGNAAHYLLIIGEFQKAKDYLNKSLQLNNKYANTHYNLAFALIQLNEKTQAAAEARIAAALYEDERYKYDAFMIIGRLSLESGNTAEAIDTFSKALESIPDAYEPLNYLIIAYLNDRNIEEANKTAAKFFHMYPKNPNATNMIINNYYSANELKSYVDLSTQLMKEYNDSEILGNLHFYRGIAYMYLSNNNSALSDLDESKKLFGTVFASDHQVFSEIENMKKQIQK